MPTPQHLDQRYLEFCETTRPIFAQYPQLEPIRQYIFRDLIVQPKPMGVSGAVKRWLRPLLRRERLVGALEPCEVLLLVEGTREVIRESIEPVCRELRVRGQRAQLLAMNGPDDLPAPASALQPSSEWFPPPWTREAWSQLCRVDARLASAGLMRSFFGACTEAGGILKAMDRALDVAQPRVAVMASTQQIGGAALAVAARARGVPTVLLQHGVLQPFYLPVLTDWMCTWGASSTRTLAFLGVETRRLRSLGSPRHDSMQPLSHADAKRRLLRSLNVDERPIIAFFSNGNDLSRNGGAPHECARWLEMAAERYRGQVHVIVRLHPNEDGSLYRKESSLIITKDRPDLPQLLNGCDVVASLCSTVMLDALLYGKPVWQLHADGWPELSTNWREGMAQRIASPASLRQAIDTLVQNKLDASMSQGVVGQVFANHGKATQTIVEFVLETARRRAAV